MGVSFLWQVNGGPVQNLGFDVTVNEDPEFSTMITEHPVEIGPDVTDYVRVALNKMTLVAFVSNEPINQENQWGTGASTQAGPYTIPNTNQPELIPGQPALTAKHWFRLPIGVPLIGSLLGHSEDVPFVPNVGLPPTRGQTFSPKVLTFAKQFDAVQQTHDKLNELRRNAQLMTVFGTKAVYENMVIENFTMSRNEETGTGALFTIALKEIRQVSTATTNAPKPSVARGNSSVKKGSQAPQPVLVPDSLLFAAGQFLSGIFGPKKQ